MRSHEGQDCPFGKDKRGRNRVNRYNQPVLICVPANAEEFLAGASQSLIIGELGQSIR